MPPQDDAARAVLDFASGPAIDAADDISQAFELAGERIAIALTRAAQSGEFSFNSLAETVAQDLARIAITDILISPLQNAIGSLGQSRANQSNRAVASSGNPVIVNMTVNGASDSQSFKRSQGQISSAITRAVISGQRYT